MPVCCGAQTGCRVQAHALPPTMPHLALPPPHRLGHALRPSTARDARRLALILAGVAAGVVLGLLALFQSVVRDSVHQAQLRHEATARHSAATWRCTGQRSLRLRDLCLAELNAPPPQVTLLTSP
mgnify:CR=1 FL=1